MRDPGTMVLTATDILLKVAMSSHVILCPCLKRDNECMYVRSMHLSLPFFLPTKKKSMGTDEKERSELKMYVKSLVGKNSIWMN